MANIRIKPALERIGSDLSRVRKHIAMYSGVSAKDAMIIDGMATAIAEEAALIAAEARRAQGSSDANTLVKKVRKALGFTYP